MSMSNRARRMAEHHLRHRVDVTLNLIPFIDILTVMVAFLLVYSTEVEIVQNTKGVEVPQSIAQTSPRQSVVVMITKTDLFVQGERIAAVGAPGHISLRRRKAETHCLQLVARIGQRRRVGRDRLQRIGDECAAARIALGLEARRRVLAQ